MLNSETNEIKTVPAQRYISLQHTAIYLGLSEKTLYEWAVSGQIPAYKVGRVWRFDLEELDRFVHQTPTCYNPDLLRTAAGLRRKGH